MEWFTAAFRLIRLKVSRLRQEWLRPIGGPVGRMRRRLVLLIGMCSIAAAVFAFPGTVMSTGSRLCKTAVFQPRLADFCGAMGIEGIPSHDERLAWEALPAGDCEAIEGYRRRYPKGAFRSVADARLAIVRVDYGPQWTDTTSLRDNLYARDSLPPFPSQHGAEADVEKRAQAEAVERCQDSSFTVPREMARFSSADLTKKRQSCRGSADGGFACSMSFTAVCHMRIRLPRQVCG